MVGCKFTQFGFFGSAYIKTRFFFLFLQAKKIMNVTWKEMLDLLQAVEFDRDSYSYLMSHMEKGNFEMLLLAGRELVKVSSCLAQCETSSGWAYDAKILVKMTLWLSKLKFCQYLFSLLRYVRPKIFSWLKLVKNLFFDDQVDSCGIILDMQSTNRAFMPIKSIGRFMKIVNIPTRHVHWNIHGSEIGHWIETVLLQSSVGLKGNKAFP